MKRPEFEDLPVQEASSEAVADAKVAKKKEAPKVKDFSARNIAKEYEAAGKPFGETVDMGVMLDWYKTL